jgi:uncharacterized oligopeptide transporter (OPT) family protein
MAGRRQAWTGITLFVLSLALPASASASALVLVLSRPAAGMEAATLVATALLLSALAHRMTVVLTPAVVTRPLTGGRAAAAEPVLFRLCPDAPGRPERPRAPGR